MDRFEKLLQELRKHPPVPGITPTQVYALPEPLAAAIAKLIRHGAMTLGEFSAELELGRAQTQQLAELLVDKGFIVIEDHTPEGLVFHVRLAHLRPRPDAGGILKALEEEDGSE